MKITVMINKFNLDAVPPSLIIMIFFLEIPLLLALPLPLFVLAIFMILRILYLYIKFIKIRQLPQNHEELPIIMEPRN
jgi:hypothetical protein